MKVFFDVDGVLIDGYHANPEIRRRWDENLQKDFGIDPDLMTEIYFNGPFTDVIVGKRSLYDSLRESGPDFGYHDDPEKLICYWFQNDSHINQDLMVYIKALSKFEDIELYIATNQEERRAKYLWDTLDFKRYFKEIFYSGDIGTLKSDPLYFQSINKSIGIEPEDLVLFFDDHQGNVEVSRNQGWRSYLYNSIDDFKSAPELSGHLDKILI